MIKIQGIPYKILTYNSGEELNKRFHEINKLYNYKDEDDTVDGFVDYNRKEIHIMIDSKYNPYQIMQTIRHELTHAFLYEIGNSNHADEDLVDKLSKWVPQLNALYKATLKDIERENKND